MPQSYREPRTLSEQEFTAIKSRLLNAAPDGLDEANFNRWIRPRLEMAIAEAENTAPAPEGSAARRFGTNLGEMINPIAIAKGLYHAATSPVETGKAILGAQGEQFSKAAQAASGGRVRDYVEAGGRAVAGAVPILGPLAAQAGEQMGEGDIAGGFGKAAGLLLPVGGVEVLSKAGAAALPANAAARLKAGAAARVAEVITPKANTNIGRRMGNTAERIAPKLLEADPSIASGFSRAGARNKIAANLDEAKAALDDAADARLSARSFETDGILADLRKKRAALTSEPLAASKLERTPTDTGLKVEPYGESIVPAPNRPRVAQIDQAIQEIEALGPTATYEALRRIRASYDGPANTVYNPSVTADFLAKKGEALGAADVTGALREHLAKFDPETAAANAQYSLFKSASDIVRATEEIERVRPKVGRQIMARLTGGLIGQSAGGTAGAVGGIVLGPIVDQALNAGVTTKLQTAKLMNDLAKAIEKGDVGRVNSLNFKVRQVLKRAESVRSGAATPQPAPQGAR